MATPASGTAPYCTNAQMALRRDWRALSELLTDADTGPPLTEAQVLLSASLTTLLKEASGEVEAACTAGQRYLITATTNDLTTLTGNSAEMLAGLVADLTMGKLYKRRPSAKGDTPEYVKDARETLERLRTGEWVFGLVESQAAGNMTVDTESSATVERRNGLVVQAGRFFGRRSNRSGRP